MIGMNSKPSIDNRMRILGIDPGLQVCGYACVETDGGQEAVIEAGVLRTTHGLPLETRLDEIALDMETLLERLTPAIVAVEEIFSHYAHPRTAILMGHARGVILQKCARGEHRGQELRRDSDQEIGHRPRPGLEGTDAKDDPDDSGPAGAAVAAGCGRRHGRGVVLCELHQQDGTSGKGLRIDEGQWIIDDCSGRTGAIESSIIHNP